MSQSTKVGPYYRDSLFLIIPAKASPKGMQYIALINLLMIYLISFFTILADGMFPFYTYLGGGVVVLGTLMSIPILVARRRFVEYGYFLAGVLFIFTSLTSIAYAHKYVFRLIPVNTTLYTIILVCIYLAACIFYVCYCYKLFRYPPEQIQKIINIQQHSFFLKLIAIVIGILIIYIAVHELMNSVHSYLFPGVLFICGIYFPLSVYFLYVYYILKTYPEFSFKNREGLVD